MCSTFTDFASPGCVLQGGIWLPLLVEHLADSVGLHPWAGACHLDHCYSLRKDNLPSVVREELLDLTRSDTK